MSSFLGINATLIKAYQDASIGLTTAYENDKFTPPSTDTDWAAVLVTTADVSPATSFDRGEDEHSGFMQVDFYTAQGHGTAALLGYCETLRQAFNFGTWLVHNGVYVLPQAMSRSSTFLDGGWMRVSCTIDWISRTTR